MAIASGAVLLDTQALTLADQAIISNDPLVKEITKALQVKYGEGAVNSETGEITANQ